MVWENPTLTQGWVLPLPSAWWPHCWNTTMSCVTLEIDRLCPCHFILIAALSYIYALLLQTLPKIPAKITVATEVRIQMQVFRLNTLCRTIPILHQSCCVWWRERSLSCFFLIYSQMPTMFFTYRGQLSDQAEFNSLRDFFPSSWPISKLLLEWVPQKQTRVETENIGNSLGKSTPLYLKLPICKMEVIIMTSS
jgi:hypothetical protein